jgi:hypothetical protein
MYETQCIDQYNNESLTITLISNEMKLDSIKHKKTMGKRHKLFNLTNFDVVDFSILLRTTYNGNLNALKFIASFLHATMRAN